MTDTSNGWTFSYWHEQFKSVDNRQNLSTKKKRHNKSFSIIPFRKLRKHLIGFKTDMGYDILLIDENNKLIGSKIVYK